MSEKDRKMVLDMFYRIKKSDPDVQSKKLKGFKNLFRVRIGAYRIIYIKNNDSIIFKHLRKRDDSTYSDL